MLKENYDIKNKDMDDNIVLEKQANEFSNRLEEIYNNIYLRREEKSWIALLNMDLLSSERGHDMAEEKLINFLSEDKYIPSWIWLTLNEEFQWTSNEEKLYNLYEPVKIYKIIEEICHGKPLNFQYLPNKEGKEVDKYIYFREKASNLKKEVYGKDVEEALFSAYKICDTDPEILKLMGLYYAKNDKLYEALQFYLRAEKINDNDIELMVLIGNALYFIGKAKEAIKYFEEAELNKRDGIECDFYLGRCYYEINNLDEAKKYFLKAIKIEAISSMKYLKNIEKLREGKSRKKLKTRKITYSRQRKIEKIKNCTVIKALAFISMIIIGVPIYIIYSLLSQPFNYIMNFKHKNIKSSEELKSISNNSKVIIKVKGIKVTNYYRLKDSRIFSENEVEENGLWNEVEGPIYSGKIEDSVVFFNNMKKANILLHPKEKYQVKGIINNLKELNNTDLYADIIDNYENITGKIIIV